MKTTKILTLTLTALIICSLTCIEIGQVNAAGAVASFQLGYVQTSYTQAIPNNLIIEAKDASNNTVTTYTGTVTLTSSDPKAILPTSGVSISNGIGGCTVYFGTSGVQSISASDSVNSAWTGTVIVTVNPIHYSVTVTPTAVNAGESVNVTVTALDAQDNILTNLGSQGYGAGIAFTSTDSEAVFPLEGSPRKLINGVRTFNITLNTPGSQTITTTCKDFNTISATTSAITVNSLSTPTPDSSASPSPEPTPSQTPTPTAVPSDSSAPTPTPTSTGQSQTIGANNALPQTLLIAIIIVVIVIVVVSVLLILKKKGKLQLSKSQQYPPPPPPPSP